jgi:competence ComEA-like helix-hairpin-helix protein
VLFGLPIELNCAGARTLEILAGIGPARAQQIVDERERRSFERVDDLLRVRGIGPKTIAALRDAVAASPARATPDAAGAGGCRPEIAQPGAENGKRMNGEHLDGERTTGQHMNGERI